MNSSLRPHLKKCSRSSGRPRWSRMCAPGWAPALPSVYRGVSCGQTSLLQTFRITVSGAPVQPEISEVRLLPSDFPCWEDSDGDENYLTRVPGLFLDLLMPMESDRLRPIPRQYRSLWLSFPIPEDADGQSKTCAADADSYRMVPWRLPGGILSGFAPERGALAHHGKIHPCSGTAPRHQYASDAGVRSAAGYCGGKRAPHRAAGENHGAGWEIYL